MDKAHVDLHTGEIHGCEKYSHKWFHEQGHIKFNSDPDKSWLLMVHSYIFDFWMLFVMASIVIPLVYPVTVTLWLFYVGIVIYEEWWCNKYADKHYWRYINGHNK